MSSPDLAIVIWHGVVVAGGIASLLALARTPAPRSELDVPETPLEALAPLRPPPGGAPARAALRLVDAPASERARDGRR